MRSAAPTAAMQRQLADMRNPKPKRGKLSMEPGVMLLPVVPGATLAEQEANWERMASAHCARLMEASKEDMK